MQKVIPILGIVAVIVQLVRFWPLSPIFVFSAFVTGAVFYIACKLGWDMQSYQINQNGYKGWGNWLSNAALRTVIFLIISLGLLFISFHNPICEETGDSLYGRCEQYSEEDDIKDVPFLPADKALYPLLLALTYYMGSSAQRIEYSKELKGENLNHSNS